jgi:hypothetical protein
MGGEIMVYLFAVFIFFLSSLSGLAFGQADYRNLDPGRPIAIEDAQPLEFRAFEFQIGLPRYADLREGGDELSVEPELKFGFAKDWQVGISAENRTVRNGESRNSFSDTQIHLFYNLNQETEAIPAIALRPELAIGTGAFGSDHPHAGLKAILSKTIGMNRIHLNGSYTVGPTEEEGRGGELVNRSLYGIAYERTFPIIFAVLLADLYAVRPIDGGPTEVIADLGGRLQLTPTWVLDAGLFRALRKEGEARYGFTVGLSTVFAFRRLFPTGRS